MPLDPSISLQTQQPNPGNLISGFLDLGLKRTALERQRATLASDISQSQAESRRAQIEADVAARTANPRVSAAESNAGTAAAQMSSAQLENARNHMSNIIQQLENLRNDPAINRKKVIDSITETAVNTNSPTSAIAQALQGLPDDNNPDALRAFVMKGLTRAQAVSSHLASVAPAPTFVNNGQQTTPVASGNPAVTGVPAGTPQGVPLQMQVPPTAQTMGPGGQPAYVGPRPNQSGPIPSGPAIGQEAGIIGPTQVATKHYESVVNDAQPAQTRIAALQTIKQEAPSAITGGGDYRRKFLQQVSGLFGVGNDEQTANDVMAKNLAVIAGQAGNTDAARTLAEMGSPNYHMTKDAIEQTGNQLIGIERKKVAAQQFFAGTPTNDPAYGAKMNVWSANADPRLWEYANLPPEQKKAWMGKLSPGVRAELGMKARALEAQGVQF